MRITSCLFAGLVLVSGSCVSIAPRTPESVVQRYFGVKDFDIAWSYLSKSLQKELLADFKTIEKGRLSFEQEIATTQIGRCETQLIRVTGAKAEIKATIYDKKGEEIPDKTSVIVLIRENRVWKIQKSVGIISHNKAMNADQ